MIWLLQTFSLLELIWELFEIAAVVVASSTGLTALIPNSSKNKYIQFFLDLFNFLAGNVFRNANKSDDQFEVDRHAKRVQKKYGCDEEFGGRGK